MKLRLFFLLFLSLCCTLSGQLAFAQTPASAALSEIFSDKSDAGYSLVKNAAQSQSTSTPFYKSNGVETRTYEGFFKAASDDSKLALLSDDGTSVWIDGTQVLDRAGQGQGFENFDSTFYPLSTSLKVGHVYKIRLVYTNTVHLNDADVDGLTLFAYDGGGTIVSPTLEVTADPTDICAGGIDSPVHQTHLTAKLKSGSETLLADLTVHFSWKMPGATETSTKDVAIDAQGSASFILKSGDEVGQATVTATCEGFAESAEVSLNLREGEDTWFNKNEAGDYVPWEGDADTSDGEVSELRFNLTFDGTPVNGHKVSWKMIKVVDSQGNPVIPNSSGAFIGYGHLSGPISTTSSSGAAYAQYYSGTKEGTVTFEVTDHSVFQPTSPIQNTSVASKQSSTVRSEALGQPAPAGPGKSNVKFQKKKNGGAGNFKLTGLTANGAIRVTTIVGDQQIIHFVTPRGASGDKITLTASISPDNATTRKRFVWQGATASSSNHLVATVSKGSPTRFVIAVKNKTTTLRNIRVWVVWSNITGNVNASTKSPVMGNYSGNSVRVGTTISATFSSQATIQPSSLITDTNRPNFSGANTVAPPGKNNAKGQPLSGGADSKWDMSRRIARRIYINATAPPLTVPPLDININFPTNRVVGNDDAGTSDENNNPYPTGVLHSEDQPARSFSLQGGVVGNSYTNRTWFQEFARLQIGNSWYVISNPLNWRVEFKFRKNQVTEVLWQIDANSDGDKADNITEAMLGADTNGDSDTNDNVGYWANNGSSSANNNTGAPE